jgi:nucleotide-binding universal stress UspA family protein
MTSDGIVAGYDGSASSEQALSWAAREARARGVTLTVCHAWGPGYAPPDTEAPAMSLLRRNGEQVLARGLRYARAITSSGQVRPLLADGSAASVLCERSHAADMVVVGSRGRGGVAGLLLGSVSAQVAAHAAGRVVIVRGHWRPAAEFVPGPVVVGADGSAGAQAAIGFAFEEAELRKTPLLAVCALADARGALGGARERQEAAEDAIRRQQKEHPEVSVLVQITDGGPRAALLAAASEAQMLVVGSLGRGGLRGMLLGSVSQAMLQHAPCPVGIAHPSVLCQVT